jgi:hypothetical protein
LFLPKLIISITLILEFFDSPEMIFLCQDILIEILLGLGVTGHKLFYLFCRTSNVLLNSSYGGDQVISENLFFFFLAIACSVRNVDLIQILLLWCKKLLGFLHRIIQINMSSIFLSLEIEMVKKFNQPLMELCDLNFRGAVLNFTLNNVNVTVFDSDQFTFFEKFGVLRVELWVNLVEDTCMLILLEVDLSLLDPFELNIEPLLLLFALFLELLLVFGKSCFFINERCDSHDFMLFNWGFLNLILEIKCFSGHLLELLLILSFLVLELGDLLDGFVQLFKEIFG